ncbi:MAG TPA: UDP-N-acetylmuramoyl-L-alanyl-D-glutamate--2,6-diaminopimelate ligase [Fibrobacteraceae bacterium]|nr:UDP-N-acetylmuramoyl-L-alanyl-D-glutamate--2,6-diaminopimelate ligase [Fibrobacteraceae bacterium]
MQWLLGNLLAGLADRSDSIDAGLVITGLADDSRKVRVGNLFLAIPGSCQNGVKFARQALQNGAVAVVAQDPAPQEFKESWIQVPDALQARLILAQTYYNNPFRHLRMHGVTGTSGKTTTAFLMDAMLRMSGRKTALLGTVYLKIGDKIQPAELTTPGVLELHAFAAEAVNAGCTDWVMEVSSHALHQGRIAGLSFDFCLFSNLSRDHLDYHPDMEAYYQAKRLLFAQYCRGVAIVNVDDPHGTRLAQELSAQHAPLLRVSRMDQKADLWPNSIRHDANGLHLDFPAASSQPLTSPLYGDFNADNIILACGWAIACRLPASAIEQALRETRVPGRFEMVFNDGQRKALVDYAHKPDALQRLLASVRTLCSGRLLLVFGCGGDRDHGKRPMMGEIAETGADYCFVTSDNPRTENPETIIQEICAGMRLQNHQVIVDRREAILYACQMLGVGDWLVVAGKGHESYQIVGTEKHHFDDREILREALP